MQWLPFDAKNPPMARRYFITGAHPFSTPEQTYRWYECAILADQGEYAGNFICELDGEPYSGVTHYMLPEPPK